ncbi:MAG: TRAP transporter small permease [Myxococcales bacterium]|nr:TRAP transporter small permease [Myxococcales bacterium]MDH3483354.1 TRAP transporter small permease [Myxococcales bacterium]
MAEPSGESPYQGPFRVLRRIDDWIFAFEMGILWTFLGLSCAMVFLDVVYRRLAAPDSKVAELTARILGIESPEAIERLTVAGPIASVVIGVGLLYFAFWTAEQHATAGGQASKSKPVIYTILSAAALGALGWTMIQPQVESRWFYTLLYALCAAPWLYRLIQRRDPHWPRKLFAFILVTAIFVVIARNYFPDGYSWSKELSLIMLLWVGFIGASVCAHEGKHIQMGALKRIVPPSLARWSEAIGFLSTAAFCFFIALLGYIYAKEALTLEGRFEQTNIPDWIATIAVPAAFAMTMLRYIAAAVSAVLGGSYGAAPEEEALVAATQTKATTQGAQK